MSVAPLIYPNTTPEKEHDREVFGFWGGFCFTINSTLGSGFLTFPWAYQHGGWVMTLSLQLVYCMMLIYLGYMLLDLLARCESIVESIDAGMEVRPLPFSELTSHNNKYQLRPEIMPEITSRKIDLCEAAHLVLGDRARMIYLTGVSLFLGSALMSYASIFASSLLENIPVFGETCRIYQHEVFSDCWARYALFVVLFAVPMLYFTIKGYEEQLILQAIMLGARLVVLLMIYTISIYAIATHTSIKGTDYNPAELPIKANWRLSAVVMSIVMFAQLYHLQFPNIIEAVQDKTKNLPRLVLSSGFVCTVLYTGIGMLASIAVPNISQASTLSFGLYCPNTNPLERPWWAYLVGYIISFFPAADVFSVFPILSVSLADNWLSLYYGSTPKSQIPRRWFLVFRSLAVVIPICMAIVLYMLDEIISFSGMSGAFLTFIMIPIMNIAARAFIDIKSPFEWRTMTPRNSKLLAGLGTLIVVYFFALYPY